MSQSVPSYIPIDQLVQLGITHTWNDWDPFEPLSWPDEKIKATLKTVSNHAITAFALGCAEWVLYRLSGRFTEPLPYDYVEAFWVFLAGYDSALPPETDSDDWEGPVLGPINLALMTVLNTVLLAEDGPPAQNGALSVEIVRHVLPRYAPFEAWRSSVLDRLSVLCPRDPADPDGPPISRAWIDPSYPLDMSILKRAMDIQMSSVNWKDNLLLVSVGH